MQGDPAERLGDREDLPPVEDLLEYVPPPEWRSLSRALAAIRRMTDTGPFLEVGGGEKPPVGGEGGESPKKGNGYL